MVLLAQGVIKKMQTVLDTPVAYQLPIGEQCVPMNALIGQSLQLKYMGAIYCTHCGKKTKTSFAQGHCYVCMTTLAQCDTCIMSPERCHYAAGTCREPEWGDAHCMVDHIVYLANSSGLKVGITRGTQVPTRWMDQGAVAAVPLFRVSTRRLSGLLEVALKAYVSDKTSWQKMLKGEPAAVDLSIEAARLQALIADDVVALQAEYGLQAVQAVTAASITEIQYPVLQYPVKVSSLNLEKTPEINGTLLGIKGQYLIFDVGVINLRKYPGYTLALSA